MKALRRVVWFGQLPAAVALPAWFMVWAVLTSWNGLFLFFSAVIVFIVLLISATLSMTLTPVPGLSLASPVYSVLTLADWACLLVAPFTVEVQGDPVDPLLSAFERWAMPIAVDRALQVGLAWAITILLIASVVAVIAEVTSARRARPQTIG